MVYANKKYMSANEKSSTIKIDIRALGYGRTPSSDERESAVAKDYFNVLDYRFLFEQAYDAILLADAAAGCWPRTRGPSGFSATRARAWLGSASGRWWLA
jgi:hypothetical protein